jgi:hypothetical protein
MVGEEDLFVTLDIIIYTDGYYNFNNTAIDTIHERTPTR